MRFRMICIYMIEIWKPIKEFPRYFVSNRGNVKNTKTNALLKPWRSGSGYRNGGGYHKLELANNGMKQRFCVHRLVADAFIPNPKNKPCVNHIDGNRKNNDIENLEWCTDAENFLWNDFLAFSRVLDTLEKLYPEMYSINQIREFGRQKYTLSPVERELE